MSTCSALAWLSSSTMRILGAGVLLLFCMLCAAPSPHTALAAGKKTAAPPVTCATCHAGVADSYAHAPMRHALEVSGANPVLDLHPNLRLDQGGYSYSVQTKDGHSTYSVSDGKETITLPLRWLFGQHSQTWVLEKDGKLYESLVSYFPRLNGLGTTPGDQKLTPHTLDEAVGRQLSVWEVRSCFNCHATNSLTAEKINFDGLRPGLDCVRCHEGAEQHMADAQHDNFKTLPKSFKHMDGESISNFCGQCHRTWDTVIRNHWHGPAFVRFQPYRLENSRCFIGNDPRISCLGCHNPHEQVKHDAAFYDGKCLACHAVSNLHTVSATAKSCPVSKANCASCHMPKVELPGGQAVFTDHYIRVVKPGEPYPN